MMPHMPVVYPLDRRRRRIAPTRGHAAFIVTAPWL
jgi:hypothetical protein